MATTDRPDAGLLSRWTQSLTFCNHANQETTTTTPASVVVVVVARLFLSAWLAGWLAGSRRSIWPTKGRKRKVIVGGQRRRRLTKTKILVLLWSCLQIITNVDCRRVCFLVVVRSSSRLAEGGGKKNEQQQPQ